MGAPDDKQAQAVANELTEPKHSSHPPSPSDGESEYFQLEDKTLVVCSPLMRRLMTLVEQVAKSNAAVLIEGETGCGKDLIARAVHHFSRRRSCPFVDINCASIPEHLVESELFGYEKGAFSGADTLKPGLFEVADTGTLFLDEIGDLDAKLQAKLLRVLDGSGYYRLGGHRKVNVDVRIIAATNQNVEALVAGGKFRKDLYHRLSQFALHVPPLRERSEDVVAIANHLLRAHCPRSRFSTDALAALRNYDWPGNVRELYNVVLKTVLTTRNAAVEICADDLPLDIRRRMIAPNSKPSVRNLSELERQTIMESVAACDRNLDKAAEELGISRRTLERKLKSYEESPHSVTSLACLRPEQQRYFRALIQVPVTLRSARGTQTGTTINVSITGVGVQLHEPPIVSDLVVTFDLPGQTAGIEARAVLAWSDPSYRCGVRFVELDAEHQSALQGWLLRRMTDDGWSFRE